MSFKSSLLVLLVIFTISFAEANEADLRSGQNSDNRDAISNVLNIESRLQTVGEVINLLTQSLVYVNDIYDLEYLTSCPFSTPSDSYREAIGNFIAQHVANYVFSPYDISGLNALETRITLVSQGMAIKQAALKANLQIQDFIRILPPGTSSPSDSYLSAISTFTAHNIGSVLSSYSPIYLINEAETYTRTVGEAMSVKNAGLIAVHNQNELFELSKFSVPNPSDSYRQAVNDFLRINLVRFPPR